MQENLNKYVCDRYYTVIDKNDVFYTGYMLNYNYGNIVMITLKGILHLEYKDIKKLTPVKDYEVSEKLKEIIEDLNKGYNTTEDNNVTEYPLCPKVDGNSYPRCLHLIERQYCSGKVCN